MALFALAAFVGWNYSEHRHDRPTACSITRRYIPRPVFVVGFSVGMASLGWHVAKHYPSRITRGESDVIR